MFPVHIYLMTMNPSTDFYYTIDREGEAEYKDRGSRFLAHAFPLEDPAIFKEKWQKAKKLHPKAVHHCFAYRIGLDGTQFRSSDDGEPAGTAGKPILGQIDSRNLTNTAVIVTRYFGGTLLGVPGLIQAYKTSAALVLQTVPIIQKMVEIHYELQFDYTRMNDVMLVIRQYHCRVIMQEMQLFNIVRVAIPKNRLEEVLYRLQDLRNVEIRDLLPK